MIALALKSGQSVSSAFEVVAEDGQSPVKEEFGNMNDKKVISGLPKVLENLVVGVLKCWSIEKKISNLYPLLQHSTTPIPH